MNNAIKAFAKKTLRYILSEKSPSRSPHEQRHLAELRDAIRVLPPINSTSTAASEAEWVANRSMLRHLILTRDPREFLQWPVVERTMFVTYASYTLMELRYLQSRSDWPRWRDAIAETRVGRPLRYGYNPLRYPFLPYSSGNLIHHAYHVARFEDGTGSSVCDLDCVVEFGGGYGSMARLFSQLGFRGKYLIFDLPEFCALQSYFLKTIGLRVVPADEFVRTTAPAAACVPNIEDLDRLVPGEGHSMFIATWSLSESPGWLREKIFPVAQRCKRFLIGYQGWFNEEDNVAYFKQMREAMPEVSWYDDRIDAFPGQNYYLMGRIAAPP